MHQIKKYANRKMYDTTDKRYVSMTQLAELIKAGEEVTIVDNRTGDDLTTEIVSKLIAQDKPSKGKVVSPQMLMQLLRKGGDTFSDYAKRYANLWQNVYTMAEDEVDKLVDKLVKNKEMTRTEARKLKDEINERKESFKKWVGDRIDRRINEALGLMNLATKEQVVDLNSRIEELNREIEELQKGLKPKRRGRPKAAAASASDAKTPAAKTPAAETPPAA